MLFGEPSGRHDAGERVTTNGRAGAEVAPGAKHQG